MKLFLLTLGAGALLALSLPPFDVEWLGWLALAPLLVAARGRRTLEAVGLGMLAGVFCGFLHVGWQPGVPGVQFAYLPFLWLAMLLGVVAALAAAARRHWEGTRWVLFVACAAVTAEWLTAFSPLPLNIALCQHRTLAVIQIASVTGIWGVSFLVWWVNAALADAVLNWGRVRQKHGSKARKASGRGAACFPGPKGTGLSRGKPAEAGWRSEALTASPGPFTVPSPRQTGPFRAGDPRPADSRFLSLVSINPGAAAVALAALVVSLGYSHFALAGGQAQEDPGQAQGLPLRVAAIQDASEGEIAPFVRAGSLGGGEVDREALTRGAAARGAKLIVGSERCLGAAFAPNAPDDPTAELARELKAYLVVGYTEAAEPKPFNGAAIVAPDGRVKGVHRKIHLFLGERQSTQSGHEAKAFETGLGRIGLEICFDSCYTDLTRRIARAGARIIAMPNWDPPTPRGVLHCLHAALLPFRAVENRIPFVRADANGLSEIVDARGRIIRQAPLYAADTLIGDVPLGDGRGTLFTRFGDWFAYLCLLIVVASPAVSAGAKKPS